MSLTIDLLRHGDVAGGTRLLGHSDLPLSELGWSQLRGVISDTCPWTQIISSPLQRCSAFAEEVSNQYSLPMTVKPELKEIGFGEWEGALFSDLYQGKSAEQMKSFWRNPAENPAPGGETYEDFEKRIHSAWNTIIQDYADQSDQHLALIIHGGVIRTLLRAVLPFPITHFFRLEVPYACLSRIIVEDGMTKILFHGGKL